MENRNFSEWLTDSLERVGMTAKAFADQVGINSQTLYNWQGGRSTPNPAKRVLVERHMARLLAETPKTGTPEAQPTEGHLVRDLQDKVEFWKNQYETLKAELDEVKAENRENNKVLRGLILNSTSTNTKRGKGPLNFKLVSDDASGKQVEREVARFLLGIELRRQAHFV